MRSQLMLIMAVAAATSFLCAPVRASDVTAGTGAYRSQEDCLRVLPAYGRKLQALGLTLAKPLECEEVQGELEAFAPRFEVRADRRVAFETAVAAPLRTHEGCVKTLQGLLTVVADPGEKIIEATCVPLSVIDQEQDEMTTGLHGVAARQFQPMVILLKEKR